MRYCQSTTEYLVATAVETAIKSAISEYSIETKRPRSLRLGHLFPRWTDLSSGWVVSRVLQELQSICFPLPPG